MPRSDLEKLLRGAAEKHGLSELIVRTSSFDLNKKRSLKFQAIAKHWNANLAWGCGVENDPVTAATVALTQFPSMVKNKALMSQAPRLPRMVVDGIDRQDIRAALKLLQEGKDDEATKLIQKVTLGWAVPDSLSTPSQKKKEPEPENEPEPQDDFDGMFD